MEQTKRHYKLVAAIDFGTSLSGYAYSTVNDFKRDKLKITHRQCWNSGPKHRDVFKTATCLLLDENKQFVAFGYDAQDKYARLQLQDEHQSYYYFHNFKMKLYNCKESLRTLYLKDIQGIESKKVAAKDVFVAAITAIKDVLMKELRKRISEEIEMEDIRWVITVPAIWPDDSKLFMRDCTNQSGIPQNQLLIALEPEAASIFCQYLETERPTDLESNSELRMTDPGTKYVVVDIGGGTTDITVHEKRTDGKLKELYKASGEGVGGTSVDDAFIQLFISIFGRPLLNKLLQDKPSTYIRLYREFEEVKKTIRTDTTGPVAIGFPCQAINSLLEKYFGESLHEAIRLSSRYGNKIEVYIDDDNLTLDASAIESLFRPVIDNILNTLQDALAFDENKEVSLAILVGGFSECDLVQKAIKDAFWHISVRIPDDAHLAVLKGAVLFGHDPTIISPRITRFTYCTNTLLPFEQSKHDPSRKLTYFGGDYCKGSLSIIMQKDKSIPLGTKVKNTITTCHENQKIMRLDFFVSTVNEPVYQEDPNCRKIGSVPIDVSEPSTEERSFVVEFEFGHTEIFITATDEKLKIKQEFCLMLQ